MYTDLPVRIRTVGAINLELGILSPAMVKGYRRAILDEQLSCLELTNLSKREGTSLDMCPADLVRRHRGKHTVGHC